MKPDPPKTVTLVFTIAPGPRACSARSRLPRSERSGAAQLVAGRIHQVEETLSPFGIARGCLRLEAGGDNACIKTVDVHYIEDHASPPRPVPMMGLRDEIEIVRANAERGESCIVAAIHELEAELTVEP